MTETRKVFHEQLDAVRRDIVVLAAKVIEAIPRGTEALLELDMAAAQALIDGDDELDSLTLELEERCFDLLARQAPVAGDMRALVTAIRLTAEIERSGDLVVNIVKGARRIHGARVPARLRGLVGAMSEQATRLFKLAVDAYADGDADLAGALDDVDDRLDGLHADYIAAIIEGGDDLDVQVAVQLALIGRYYERIGDHAVNIGERVRYMVTGWMPEHTGAARLAARTGVAPRRPEPPAAVDPVVEAPPEPPAAVEPVVEPPTEPGAALQASARFGRALAAIPQGVVIFDGEGELMFRNEPAAGYLAARHGEALVEEAIARVVEEVGAGAVPTGAPDLGQRTVDLYGPPRQTLVLRAIPLAALDDDPSSSGVLVVIDDVSERRRLEAVRRDFVANISHELKTPVGGIALLAETLASEDDPAVARRLAERLVGEAFRVGRTIDDLLELSWIEVEEAATREPVPADACIDEAVDRARQGAEARQVEIVVEEPADRLHLLGDRRQLVSALANLLDNAVKYSEEGSTVEIRTRVDDGWIELEVQDHGIGIPRHELDRVFERFYRVDRARSRETGGTGLGLAIVRHVASNHRGEVRVESQEGQGSTFTLRLPGGPGRIPDPAEAR